MWIKNLALVSAGLLGAGLVIGLAALAYGQWRWQRDSTALVAAIDAARLPLPITRFYRSDLAEVANLPAPVNRYFDKVLQDGQRVASTVRLSHEGTFNMGETQAKWAPFTSKQLVATYRPGFDWQGHIRMGPGLFVGVHDAYIAGRGVLTAKFMNTVTLADLAPTPALAQGELMRWLAEACWYPTALLPSQGVVWSAVSEHSARATLADKGNRVSLLFHFNADGLIERVSSDSRPRTVGKNTVNTPWVVTVGDYQKYDGMLVPTTGEAAWVLPSGHYPYWRGRITHIEFDWAP